MDRGKVLLDIEAIRIDQRLHGAAIDEAHGDRRQPGRRHPGEPLRLRLKHLLRQPPEGRAVALERGADLRPEGRVAGAERPVLQEEAGLAGVTRQAIHLAPQQSRQTLRRALETVDLLTDFEGERAGQHPVQHRGHELVLPFEMEKDEAVAQSGRRRDGSHGEAGDPAP